MEAGRAVKGLARELGVSEATLYTWKSKYGGLDVNEARRLKELEEENRRLKHMWPTIATANARFASSWMWTGAATGINRGRAGKTWLSRKPAVGCS